MQHRGQSWLISMVQSRITEKKECFMTDQTIKTDKNHHGWTAESAVKIGDTEDGDRMVEFTPYSGICQRKDMSIPIVNVFNGENNLRTAILL